MHKKLVGFLVLVAIILGGCSTENYFGKSSKKEIIEFRLEGQIGSTVFSNDTILVSVAGDVYSSYLSNLSASRIKVSDYATVSPEEGEKQNFSSPVPYTVFAEDGSSTMYYVVVQPAGTSGTAGYQLPNSSFDFWHEVSHSKKDYFEIGFDAQDKTWGTGNQGVALAITWGSNADYPTTRYEREPNQYAAELTTQNMGSLAAGIMGGYKGVAAGNVFVGEFVVGGLTDAHPIFGYPYSQKPKAFQVEYTYAPAQGLLNGRLNPVEGIDMLDMYLILEKREGDQVKRLGVAWFRSGEAKSEWTAIEKEIKYAYGEAPEGLEDYEKRVLKYGIDGDQSVTNPNDMPYATWGDISKENPTHIFMSFTSSYQGDYFIGAPGSKLRVDNVKLIY
ncbi:MAG: PCMD domain-containing protein [Bacteroidales bacterium]|nr:PCMD domain-containing protein [Bacteroidales bacterium]MDD4671939.1 PCMD domain-containing protein [Bacteroidales bacterium]MDY0347238.1 PCMD domain-containing protein [Tenuifilaceae bacterium]